MDCARIRRPLPASKVLTTARRGPHAGADARWSGAAPFAAALRAPEPSRPIGDARPGDRLQRRASRRRYAAAQLDRVERIRPAARMNAPVGDAEGDRDDAAVPVGRNRGHAPGAVEFGGAGGRRDCENCKAER